MPIGDNLQADFLYEIAGFLLFRCYQAKNREVFSRCVNLSCHVLVQPEMEAGKNLQ